MAIQTVCPSCGARSKATVAWVAEQVQEARSGRPIREPERRSDASLVGIIQGLRDHGASAQPIVKWLDEWLARDNFGAQGYWGYLHIISPNGPDDVRDLGVSLQNRGYGLITAQGKYEVPLTEKLTTTSAAGWVRC